MGIDYTVYIGAYLCCENGTVKTTVKRGGCVNEKCKRNKMLTDGAFCFACGNALGEFEKELEVDRVSHEDAFNAHGEKLYTVDSCGARLIKDCDLYLSNLYPLKNPDGSEKTLGISIDFRGETFAREFDPLVVAEQIKNFKEQHRIQIQNLQALYGNCEVKWGIIHSAN